MSVISDSETFSKLNALSALINNEDAEFKDAEAKLEVKQREIFRQGQLHQEQIQRSAAQQQKLSQLLDTTEQELLMVTTKMLTVQDLAKNLADSRSKENEEHLSTLVAGFRSVALLEKASSAREEEISGYLKDNTSLKNFREQNHKLQDAINDSQDRLDTINHSLESVQEKTREASNREASIKYETDKLEHKKRSLIDEIGILKEEEQAREVDRSYASMQEELADVEKAMASVSTTLEEELVDIQKQNDGLVSLNNAKKAHTAAGEGRRGAELALGASIYGLQKEIESAEEDLKNSASLLSTLHTDITAGKAKNVEQATRIKYTKATIESMGHTSAQVNSHIEDLKQQICRTTGACETASNSPLLSDATAGSPSQPTPHLADQSDPRLELRLVEAKLRTATEKRDALEEDHAAKLAAIGSHNADRERYNADLDAHASTIARLQKKVGSLDSALHRLQSSTLTDYDADTFLNSGQSKLKEDTTDAVARLLGFTLYDTRAPDSQDDLESEASRREESLWAAICKNRDAITQTKQACEHLAGETKSRQEAIDKLQADLTRREDDLIAREVESDVTAEIERNQERFQKTLSKLDDDIQVADKAFREAMKRLEEQQAVTEESFQGEYRAKLKELQAIKMRAIVGSQNQGISQPQSHSQEG